MRIAFVVHQYPPEHIGGTEVYTASLARCLAEQGHEVHVFYPRRGAHPGEPAHTVQGGVHLWRALLPARPADPWGQFWQSVRNARVERTFRAFLAAVQPEVVHFQHLQNVSVRLPRLARSRPQVLTLHDYWYLCPNGQLILPNRTLCPEGPPRPGRCAQCALGRLGQTLSRAFAPLLAPLLAWRNDYVKRSLAPIGLFLTPSAFAREVYIRGGWAAERIRVFELGLDPARLVQRAPIARGPYRLHLGYLGAIAWQKGVHVLIEAFSSLPSDAALTLYGDTSTFPGYATSLREAARRHPGIRFAGLAPSEAVGDILRQFDYLVVPSLWRETFGMVVQEAEAVGTPVIASRIGALQRIRDGVSGRLFEPGDAQGLARILRELYDHPEQRALYQAHLTAGPLLADQAQRLVEIYRALLEGRPLP